ncbi:hypothetical protein [Acidithrix ferrooxidans]|uniref:Uncharacterized protein n=1 Tax=Acidithrix ferrooxidans TaxID=1280514 RepID=A0A0D8HE85_9ACTN|nr:hypothetical protein [Acidithrix ferrooxidans]KJF16275.1 hypothetical protein AXFE_28760 [Acidithrix ferrooxidans]
MFGFPIFGLLAYFGQYAHPYPVAGGVAVAILGGCCEISLLRKGAQLGGRIILPFDLAIIAIVALLSIIGAGPLGRRHGLDGFTPYVMMIAGLAGIGAGMSWRGITITAIAGAIWAVMPLGRGAIIWNDEGGFLLWLISGSLVAAA